MACHCRGHRQRDRCVLLSSDRVFHVFWGRAGTSRNGAVARAMELLDGLGGVDVVGYYQHVRDRSYGSGGGSDPCQLTAFSHETLTVTRQWRVTSFGMDAVLRWRWVHDGRGAR